MVLFFENSLISLTIETAVKFLKCLITPEQPGIFPNVSASVTDDSEYHSNTPSSPIIGGGDEIPPIHNLATEVLLIILENIISSEQISWTSRSSHSSPCRHNPTSHIQPFVLSHVCTRWRSILLDKSSFWDYLVVCSHHPTHADLLTTWLNRAPPRFSLIWRVDDSNLRQTFGALLPHIGRCTNVRVHTDLHMPDVALDMALNEKCPVTPWLTSMSVTGSETVLSLDTSFGDWLISIMSSAKDLKTLKWGYRDGFPTLQILQNHAHTLTHLFVDGGSEEKPDVLTIIATLPSLETLHLGGTDVSADDPGIVAAPRLYSATFRWVSLTCKDFLQYVSAPRLKSLDISISSYHGEGVSYSDMGMFLSRSQPPLQSLAIYRSDDMGAFSEAQLLDLLSTPCFQHSLTRCFIHNDRNWSRLEITEELLDSMTHKEDRSAILPKLSSIYISGYDAGWEDGTFQRMIMSRIDQAQVSPITNVHFDLYEAGDDWVFMQANFGVRSDTCDAGHGILPEDEWYIQAHPWEDTACN